MQPTPLSAFFRRIIPAELPPEVGLIAILFFIGGCTGLLKVGEVLLEGLVTGQLPALIAMPQGLPLVRELVLGVAKVVISLALLRKQAWARQGSILLAVAVLLVDIGMYFMPLFSSRHVVPTSLAYGLRAVLESLAYLLFYSLLIYVLARPHVRRAFGDSRPGLPQQQARFLKDGDAPPPPTAWEAGSACFFRLTRRAPGVVAAVIAAFFIRDGVLLLCARAITPFERSLLQFGYLHRLLASPGQLLIDVAISLIGVLAIIAGVALLNNRYWARDWSTAVLVLLGVKAAGYFVIDLLLHLGWPFSIAAVAGLAHRFLLSVFDIVVYLALWHFLAGLGTMQKGEREMGAVLGG